MPVLNHEFNGLVRYFGSLVPHTLTASEYANFEEMRADYHARGSIKVNVEHSTGTIFGDPTLNWLGRAWHDMCHIITGGDFSRDGEYKAMLEQWRQTDNYPVGISLDEEMSTVQPYDKWDWFKRIVYAEVMGQFDYQAVNGYFPKKQYDFVTGYLWKIRNKSLDELL